MMWQLLVTTLMLMLEHMNQAFALSHQSIGPLFQAEDLVVDTVGHAHLAHHHRKNKIVKCTTGWQINRTCPCETAKYRSDPYCQVPKVAFIHIPKNAGSAIETAGWFNQVQWGYQYDKKRFYSKPPYPPVASDIGPVCGPSWHDCCSMWHIPPRYLRDWR